MAINAPASGARTRAYIFVAVTVACALIAAVLCISIADRYAYRTDLSVVGGQRLADRTKRVLASIQKPVRVVVAAEISAADRQARERLVDVLDEFSRTNANCQPLLIDTAAASGPQVYQQLLGDLVARQGGLLAQQAIAIEQVRAACAAAKAFCLDVASPRLIQLEPAAAAAKASKDYFTQAAAAVRLAAKDISDGSDAAEAQLKTRLGDVAVPRTDLASASIAKAIVPLLGQFDALIRELRTFAGVATDPAASAAAKDLANAIQQQRDKAAVAVDSLRRLKRPDLLRVVDVLATGSAALILSENDGGIAAVDVKALLPSAAWLAASGADMTDQSRRVEELLVGGIATVLEPQRPIAVFVHGETREILGDAPVLSMARQRLESRGVDVIEWACVLNPSGPALGELDPEGKRPVVYFVMSADSASDSGKAGPNQLSGVKRCEKVGETVAKLIREGRNVCVALNPSVVATYGDKDPIAAALAPMGIGAESGRPLLREQMSGGSRAVATDLVVQATGDAHALGGAIRGLPTTMAWAIALKELPVEGECKRFAVLTVPASPALWAESQWLSVWQTPRDKRGLISEPPKFDAGRDLASPPSGDSWVVVMAAERHRSEGHDQRAIAVGSNSWLIDQVAGRQAPVDGRQVSVSPGNFELLDAALFYLAGRDEMIAQSASARNVAMVQPIADDKLTRIRLAISLGLPIVALLLGALVRMLRG
jgi:hypothetical protein